HPAHWTKLKADVVASLGTHYLQTQPPHHTSLSLNGTLKQVLAFIVEQQHYVRLRDLADDKIEVGYDAAQKIPTVEVKEK
ncbi:MAG: hypothetical protein RR490_09610, partial [Niameybacter sp.]